MQNLLQVLLRYGSFFSFILLESICIYFLVTYNDSQREIYLYSSQLATGKIYESMHEVRSYVELNSINDSLAAENARLKAQLFSIVPDSNLTPSSFPDYQITACEVINNNVLGRNNMMTLDKGELHGLERSMGLVDDKGIVGIIKRTGQNYSSAYSILNTDIRISARLKRNQYFGTLTWPAKDLRVMELRSIPKHADIRLGDTVTTTSYSTIFPPDVPIGLVENVRQLPGRSDFTIDVKLFNDLANVKVVYAVKKKDRSERVEVENDSLDE